MVGPPLKPPGYRLPPELRKAVARARNAQGAICTPYVGVEDNTPLKFVQTFPARKKDGEEWKKRKLPDGTRPEGYERKFNVWRMRGRFCKAPTEAEKDAFRANPRSLVKLRRLRKKNK